MAKFAILTNTICEGWVNVFREDAGIDNPEGTPILFDSYDEALTSLIDHFKSMTDAGMDYDDTEYKIEEL